MGVKPTTEQRNIRSATRAYLKRTAAEREKIREAHRERRITNKEIHAERRQTHREIHEARRETGISLAATKLATQGEIIQLRREAQLSTARQVPVERYKGQLVTRAADTAISTATPSSNSNVIMVFLFTMAGLIVLYNLVTKGPALSGFLGGLGDWLSLLTTTTPIFRVNPKGAQNMPQSQPNTQSQPKSSSNEVTK